MYPQSTDCVQSPVAVRDLTLVMFRFLMVDEDFEVIEVFVAVEAPWPLEKLLQRRPVTLAL
jgi:hypothetical protein